MLLGCLLLTACTHVNLPPASVFQTEALATSITAPAIKLKLRAAFKAAPQTLADQAAAAVPAQANTAPRLRLPGHIKGISYFPQANPWERFWQHYDSQVVQQDLQLVSQMGFNTVRIFVFYELFGGAKLDATASDKLRNFLDQAEAQGLKVVVTLFDQYQQYAPEHYAAGDAHLSGLSQAIGQHPALLAWDLKNESDLDYATNGTDTVKAWIQHMADQLRSLDRAHPITASYADAARMGAETDSLDYLTFHYYGPEQAFAAVATDIKTRFPGKAAVLGEFGFHTWASRPGDAHPPAHQYNYFNAILAGAAKAGLQGTIAWNLHDYPDLPDVAVIKNQPVNCHLGLLDLAGRSKTGVLALQQSVRVIDADTQTAVTPQTRQLELIYTSATSNRLELNLQRAGLSERQLSFASQPGLNSQRFSVSPHELKDLLELRLQAVVSAPDLSQSQTLILRRD